MVRNWSGGALAILLWLVAMPPAAAWALGLPSQAAVEGASVDADALSGWPTVAGAGVPQRPFVQRLVVDGTVLIDNGKPAPASTAAAPTAAVLPLGRGASRVGVALGVPDGTGALTPDLAGARGPAITPDSVIDLTLRLGALSPGFTWAWLNGHALSYLTTGLGTADAAVKIVFNPVTTPWVDRARYAAAGCTSAPPVGCEVPRADGRYLGANLVLNFAPDTADALTGALFATTGAVAAEATTLSGDAPALSVAIASATAAGDGTLQAFLPAASLLSLFGIAPTDAVASSFVVSRAGDPVRLSNPEFVPQGNAGVLMNVSAISISAPEVRMRSAVAGFAPQADSAGGLVTISAMLPKPIAQACMGTCAVWVRPILGRQPSMQAGFVVAQAAVMRGGFAARVARSAIGSAYVASVYRWSGDNNYTLLASGVGTIK